MYTTQKIQLQGQLPTLLRLHRISLQKKNAAAVADDKMKFEMAHAHAQTYVLPVVLYRRSSQFVCDRGAVPTVAGSSTVTESIAPIKSTELIIQHSNFSVRGSLAGMSAQLEADQPANRPAQELLPNKKSSLISELPFSLFLVAFFLSGACYLISMSGEFAFDDYLAIVVRYKASLLLSSRAIFIGNIALSAQGQ